MAIVLRYIERIEFIMERLVDIVHVQDTSALSLKEAIVNLLAQHSSSISSVRGQCYDGASNMQVLSLVVVPIICIGVRKFGRYLRKLSHETQTAASYEPLINVSLEIKDFDNLHSTLDSFTRVEKLDDPEIDLLRFQTDGSVVRKSDKHVSFPLELDLLPYTENNQTNNVSMCYRYELVEYLPVVNK
ncbi:hypothetical protein CQW23_09690 [Capsicum baccatum]|uniref:DUF4371 domain-containing protein n=1 Tax=Capsicum baccatum TaxID=33114 RepID=A0A2G2WXH9_CAPBA|nr:hypothetical protein CQW23_09690 [Capsicum baccatum]